MFGAVKCLGKVTQLSSEEPTSEFRSLVSKPRAVSTRFTVTAEHKCSALLHPTTLRFLENMDHLESAFTVNCQRLQG